MANLHQKRHVRQKVQKSIHFLALRHSFSDEERGWASTNMHKRHYTFFSDK